MTKILITGGSGMIGRKISERLSEQGYEIVHLSRNPTKEAKFKSYRWDISKGKIDEKVFQEVKVIIHLAGENIAQRWTKKSRQGIIRSRVDSGELLFKYVNRLNVQLESFIGISGIGYYGGDTGEEWLSEGSENGSDFIGQVAAKWEQVADRFQSICSVSKIRAGIVLSTEGGALPKIALPIRFGVGAAIGSGKQYMSWIHIDDLVSIFTEAVKGNLSGTFNAVADPPVTNKVFTKTIALTLNRPFFLPNIPAILVHWYFGEMAVLVTGGNKVSNEKLKKSGFHFRFAHLEIAIKDLLT